MKTLYKVGFRNSEYFNFKDNLSFWSIIKDDALNGKSTETDLISNGSIYRGKKILNIQALLLFTTHWHDGIHKRKGGFMI